MSTPHIQSVERAFSIITEIYKSKRVLSIEEIANSVNLNYKTVHRFLTTLEHIGAVSRVGRGQFTLGMYLSDIGDHVAIQSTLRRAANPFLKDIVAEFGVNAQIFIRHNHDIISIAHVGGRDREQHGITIERTLPIYCTASGKVIMAGMRAEKLHDFLKLVPLKAWTLTTLVSRSALTEQVRIVRERGYAVNDGEYRKESCGLAVPISSNQGKVLAALAVSGNSKWFDRDFTRLMIPRLRSTAEIISNALYERTMFLSE